MNKLKASKINDSLGKYLDTYFIEWRLFMKDAMIEAMCNMYPNVFDEMPEDNYDYVPNPYTPVVANGSEDHCDWCYDIPSLDGQQHGGGVYYDPSEDVFDFWVTDLRDFESRVVLYRIKHCPYCGKRLEVKR